jgi:hypothetical protein
LAARRFAFLDKLAQGLVHHGSAMDGAQPGKFTIERSVGDRLLMPNEIGNIVHVTHRLDDTTNDNA